MSTETKPWIPSEEEKEKVKSVVSELEERINSAINVVGIKADVRVAGSVARDTFLPGDHDIDAYVIAESSKIFQDSDLLSNIQRRIIENGYSKRTKFKSWCGVFEGFNVEIGFLDDYDLKVQRAIAHQEFFSNIYSRRGGLVDEVRKLKFFLKNIGAYGVKGVLGAGAEMLVTRFGDFEDIIRQLYEKRRDLIVKDPTDPDRDFIELVDENHWKRLEKGLVNYIKKGLFKETSYSYEDFVNAHKGWHFIRREDTLDSKFDSYNKALFLCRKIFNKFKSEKIFPKETNYDAYVSESGVWVAFKIKPEVIEFIRIMGPSEEFSRKHFEDFKKEAESKDYRIKQIGSRPYYDRPNEHPNLVGYFKHIFDKEWGSIRRHKQKC